MGMGASRASGAQQMAGRMYGKIVESQTGKGLDAASVQLLQNKFDSVSKKRQDVIIGGMLTQPNGEFSLENVPLFGPLKLKITAIGFKALEKPVSFDLKMGGNAVDMSAMLNAIDKDLGNIKVEVDAQVLGGVTVSSSKSLFQLGIDRKIFNVEKDLVSTGGTAVDVMKNIPSISVDIDGNVTLRNNAPQIFVDGRPTTMQLDQIPADAIESVEIITNPSAKFDASGGTSGILNVVLKKNKKVGYNGSVRASIDSRAKVGLGGDINLRQNKINLFASGNFNQSKSKGTGNTERYNILDNPNTILYQNDKSVSSHNFGFGRAGFDFFVNNRNTISANVSMVRGKFKPESISELLVDSLYNVKTSSYTERLSNTEGEFRRLGSQLSFKHNFPKPGREWTADATFNSSKNESSNLISTDYYFGSNTIQKNFLQQQNGTGDGKNLVIQSDFVNPITEKSKLEMGIRGSFNESNSTNAFYMVSSTGQLILQPSSQVDYKSNDHVIAGYTTFTNQLKSFGYQLGLRVESSSYDATLIKTNEKFKNDFPLSFFPSIFLTHKMKNDQDLQLNYTRRIRRPNFFQLSPFTDSSDFLNLRKGNPGLKPEFTNSVEVSYQKVFENKDNILTTLYYKNTNNLITSFQEKYTSPVNGKDYVLNTYINANSSYVTGLEVTMKNKVTKIWDLTSNLNLYTSKIKIDDPTQPKQDQFMSWYGKLNNTFKLPKNFTIQISGEYQSKTILPPGGSSSRMGGGFMMGMGFGQPSSAQGYVRPNYFMDAAIKYEFLKNKAASISLNINDIFRTRRSYTHSESPYFVQDVFRRRDPQVLRLNFSWRFGKFDPNLFKRKNMKSEREMMNNMDMNQ